MSDVVISARGLGKRYLIGHETVDRNQTFRERIMAGAGGLARNLAKTVRGEQLVQGEVEEFWALKDVAFDIRRGDTVGIIGRNGAGKSTLLKILSRITEPTTGRVDIRGRVASLLEVGTGFHPELTGRENIFLNGAILGMSRAEIRRKLDEIVDFAGVERFLDTPVKRYSSGMGVRLGFSVAAHLEPEILIVDEVLAVGDAAFQRKCIEKMSSISTAGRTIIFVSHNMGAISRLCRKAIYLQNGDLRNSGPAAAILSEYYRAANSNGRDVAIWRGGASSIIQKIEVLGAPEEAAGMIKVGRPFIVSMNISSRTCPARVRIDLVSDFGEKVVDFDSANSSTPLSIVDGKISLHCDSMLLIPGSYSLNAAVYTGGVVAERVEPALSFSVVEGECAGAFVSGGEYRGVVHLPHSWLPHHHR